MKDILREWLEYLNHHGPAPWSAMPKMKNGKTVSHLSWGAWVRKGFVVTEFSLETGRVFRLPDSPQT